MTPSVYVRLGARFDVDRAAQLGDRLGHPIRALQDERQVVAGEDVAWSEIEDAAERAHRFRDVLFRLGEAQRKPGVGIVRRRRDERARTLDSLRSAAGCHECEDQIVGSLADSRDARRAPAIRVNRGFECAETLECFAEAVLNLGIGGVESGGFPQERQRRLMIARALELERTREGVPGARRAALRRRRILVCEPRRNVAGRGKRDHQESQQKRCGAPVCLVALSVAAALAIDPARGMAQAPAVAASLSRNDPGHARVVRDGTGARRLGDDRR